MFMSCTHSCFFLLPSLCSLCCHTSTSAFHRYVIASGEVNLAMFFIDRGKVDILSHSTSTSKPSSRTNTNTRRGLSTSSKITFEDTEEDDTFEDTEDDTKEDDADKDASPGGTTGRQEMIFATLNTGDFFGEKVRLVKENQTRCH